MKKRKRFLCVMLALLLVLCVFGITPITAKADQPVISFTEYSWNEGTETLQSTTRTTSSYTVVTSDFITNSPDDGAGLLSGDYVVNADTTISDYVYIRKNQTVNLIVQNGVTLTCKQGIGCGYNKSKEYATLNIYGTGKIVATGKNKAAGIGGDDDETNGNITIHGTTIEATGGKHGAGIGGGEGGKDPDDATSIKIFAGDITAKGGVDGAGIGGGDNQQGALTYIYGGNITASSEKHGAGIGGGDEENTRGIYIYNGNITATGGSHGAGIGAGEHGGNIHEIKIMGGNIDAKGGYFGAGIGGGFDEDMSGEINISGDVHLTAKAGLGAAGIGAGSGADWFPDGDMDGTIRINAGEHSDIKVYALNTKIFDEYDGYDEFRYHTCEDDQIDFSGAGIGAGYGGNMGGEVYITGGNMEIWSGVGGAGIGGGRENAKTGGEGNDVYIGGGNIKVRAITYCESGAHKDLKSYNSAIGCGHYDSKDGSVYIHPDNNTTGKYMKVVYTHLGEYMDDDFEPKETAKASDRSKKCHTTSWLEISECDHRDHNGVSGLSYTIEGDKHRVKCKYCGYDALEDHDGSIPCGDCGYRDGVTYYSVTLNTQFGDPVQLDTTLQYVASGKKFTFPECDKVPVGKRFIGWRLVNDTNLRQPGESFEPGSNRIYDAVYADLYSITYNHQIPNDNWISVSKAAADEGEAITVTAHPYGGYRMKTVTVREDNENGEIIKEIGCEPGKNACTFNMPANNIYITAEFEEAGYVVGISDTENGTVTADPPSIAYTAFDNGGTPTVTITAVPKEGYSLDNLRCEKSNEEEIELTQVGETDQYTFTMPAENVFITADFELIDPIGAKLAGHSLILGDDIGVDFYMELSDEVANDETAYMHFTLPNESVKDISVNGARKDGKYHVFRCEVAAKEMTSNITAAMYCNSGSASKEYTYTVKEYADHILDEQNGYDDKTKDLVKAMLHYGGCAQQLFSYNTSNRADSGLDDYSASVQNVSQSVADKTNDVPDYTDDITMTYAGSSLVLRSKTVYKLYFTSQKKANELPSLVNTDTNQTYKPIYRTLNGTQYVCYEITGISPQNIRNNISLTYSGTKTNLTVNIGEYARLTMTDANAADEEKALINALYNYCDKAVAFAGNGGN